MQNIPHWQLLLLLYIVIVAIPVYWVHMLLKMKLLSKKSVKNLFVYCIAVTVTAFLMNYITMLVYYKFLFKK